MRLAVISVVCLLAALAAFADNGAADVARPIQDNLALYVCSHPEGGQGKLAQLDANTGEKVRDISGVSKPVDADVGPGDDIFITDDMGEASCVFRYDPDTGEMDGNCYGETSYLAGARGLAFKSDNYLYVADMTLIAAEVVEFNEEGIFMRVLPDDPLDPVLLAIEDVCCDANGDIYVTQWYDDWLCETPGVYKFSGDGWTLFGETDNLESPWGLAFGPDGDLYVAEEIAPQPGIQRYDGATGAWKGVYGDTGSSSNLAWPGYLTFGPHDDDLYVTDAKDSSVRKFSGPLKPDAGTFKGVFVTTLQNVPDPIGLVFGPAGGSSERPELSIQRLENGDMLLTLIGTQGKSYDLRYTSDPTVSDFTQWTSGAIINLEGKTSDTWTDGTVSESLRRFYRAKEQ